MLMIRVLIAWLAVVTSIGAAYAAEPVTARGHDFMAGYREGCGDKIYASCVDQAKLLRDGLRRAHEERKLALVIFGFNACPPCNVLDRWLTSPEGAALEKPYVQIDLSIFDETGALRPEIYTNVLPNLKLAINQAPPYGVPLFAIVDPTTEKVVGKAIVGFSADHHAEHAAYLKARRGNR